VARVFRGDPTRFNGSFFPLFYKTIGGLQAMKRHARGSQQADALNLKAPNEPKVSKAKPKKSKKPKKPKKPKIECPGCEQVHGTFTPSTLHAGGQSAYTHDCTQGMSKEEKKVSGLQVNKAYVNLAYF
jgi:hypothetical protein